MDLRKYVGRPWSAEYNCWALVQEVQREEFGREMPELAIDSKEPQQEVIRSMISRGSPWVHAAVPGKGDIVVCRAPSGPHVGVVVGRRIVLHNRGAVGSPGAVRIDHLDSLRLQGYTAFTFWRPRDELSSV